MEVTKSDYVASFPNVGNCLVSTYPEYAFIGRSNVGKSSLINMLTNRKSLARISKQPGKTQSINYYYINEDFYIVDLPGYGYAKTNKKQRADFEDMISGYMKQRENLMSAFILIDSNIPPQKIDIEFINWMGQNTVPFSLVFTKTDKSSPNQINSKISAIKKELLKYWNELPPTFRTSSEEGTGKEKILGYIDSLNAQWNEMHQ